MKIHFRGKNFWVETKKTNFLTRISGLMFRTRDTENLLFDFGANKKPAIHSMFVFFDFLAIWMDSKGKVVDYGIVKPFRLCITPRKDARFLLEVPLSDKNRKIVSYFSSG